MEYLLAALQKRQRRMRLEQWLLLRPYADRACGGLAVAQPYFEHDPAGFAPGGRTHRVLVVDGSYSMLYQPDDKSRFERAKELARRIVAESPPHDGFSLVLMSRRRGWWWALRPSSPASSARRSTTCGPRKPRSTCRRRWRPSSGFSATPAAKIPASRGTRSSSSPTWDGPAGHPARRAAAEIRRRARSGQRRGQAVRDRPGPAVGRKPGRDRSPCRRAGGDRCPRRALRARVKNFGLRPQMRRGVELLVEAGPWRSNPSIWMPAARNPWFFPIVLIPPATMPSKSAWMPATAWKSTTIVSWSCGCGKTCACCASKGRPSATPGRSPADYLLYALSPQGDDSRRGTVRAEAVPESGLLERDLGRYDCVFLHNVAQFTPSEARRSTATCAAAGAWCSSSATTCWPRATTANWAAKGRGPAAVAGPARPGRQPSATRPRPAGVSPSRGAGLSRP